MKTLIVEDNEIEAENLKILLEGFEHLQLIGAVDSVAKGFEIANSERPDLILLDVEVQGINSLEHIHLLNYDPYIVCCTLHRAHALKAYEVGVIDYLTKPIIEDQLERALKRITERGRVRNQDAGSRSISLKKGTQFIIVPFTEIMLITADGDYSMARNLENSEFIADQRMKEWAQLLPATLFLTLDRSTIVNRQQIVSFSQLSPDRTAKITFHNGYAHTIGAAALRRLKSSFRS
jgi:two-component system, LytTR family, response regulator